jgi:outer membrane protein OmpA-like peptidoglycan-associated protein
VKCNRTLEIRQPDVAHLMSHLGQRQLALDRFASGPKGGGYQARTLIDSMRNMVRALNVSVPFRTACHTLEDHQRVQIERLAGSLRSIPVVSVNIEGHSDTRGGRRFNRKLALRRAWAVRDVFVANGVARERLEAGAVGAEEAMYRNGDRGGYPFDRRVIITFNVEEVGA